MSSIRSRRRTKSQRNQSGTAAHRRAASSHCRRRKTAIEKPYHDQIVAREVAKLPEYMQLAWQTPRRQRTEGQRLNVVQIEDTLKLGSLRNLVQEEHVVALMPDDVRAQARDGEGRDSGAREAAAARGRRRARAIGERGRTPQPSYFLHRGSPDARGSLMAPGVLSVASERRMELPGTAAGRAIELAAARLRRVARRTATIR